MQTKWIFRVALSSSIAVMLSACVGPTQLEGQWKNPQCSECFPAKSALVVVATPNVVARRLLEDELAKQLRQHQVQAVVSYLYFSTPTSNTADNHSQEVLALAKQLHLDNILTTQVMKVTQPQVYSAPAPVWGWNNFPGYYQGLWAPTYDFPATVYVAPEIYAQTTLYNVPHQKFSWMGSTQTTPVGYSMAALAQQMAGLLVGEMATQNVIGPQQADSLALSAP
ncbi:hypothetical protein [Plesiomonas shigelloides]|uniref:hypothetical protein n=1 Tax=Plesiomonas shigelloides TaxID=703 RepID=UPI001C5B34DE|nr:hypothetical protein [Plesiomonas shigelloides]MBW3793276.1 hypothetical protein [Plesiomonas shigelloides]